MPEPGSEQMVGVVKKFFSRVSVAAIELTQGRLGVGDTIHIKGHTTDLEERVDSLEVEHQAVENVAAPALIGVKVGARVREHDAVFLKGQ
jgi:hypothetical protein